MSRLPLPTNAAALSGERLSYAVPSTIRGSASPQVLGVLGLALLVATFVGFEPLRAAVVTMAGQTLASSVTRTNLTSHRPVTGFISLGGSVARAKVAVKLAQSFPGSSLVLSGPGESEVDYVSSQLGKDPRYMVDRRATTTYENARYTQDLVKPRDGERWIVVTSGIHMPRALAAFRAVGFDVEPWPVDDLQPHHPDYAGSVQHEVLGLAWYWLLGRAKI